jgi:hypothetical protein
MDLSLKAAALVFVVMAVVGVIGFLIDRTQETHRTK